MKVELPEGLAEEWCAFLDTEPSLAEINDWCQEKADKHMWNVLDLSGYLFLGVRKPHLPEITTEPPEETN